jgi:hypothetical protein
MKALLGLTSAALLAGSCLLAVNATSVTAYAAASPVMMQERWEAPPGELDEVGRHGFHDGVEGARKDYGNHRRPDVNNREEFRHPHVPERDREAYRRGFERGYQAGVDHLYHGHI